MALPYERRISRYGNAILTEASWFGARAFRESARSEYCRAGGGFCVAAIAWSVLKRYAGEVTLPPNQAVSADGMKVVERQFEVLRQHVRAIRPNVSASVRDVQNGAVERFRIEERFRALRDRRSGNRTSFNQCGFHTLLLRRPYGSGRRINRMRSSS
jgi:hypothetical protein